MTAQLAPSAIFRSWDNLGLPLVGGKLNTYVAGTTTPQATYTDSTQGTPNTNPVILNFRGEAFVWLDPTLTYKFVLTDALNNLIWTEDNIPGGFGANPLNVNLIPNPTNTFTLGNSTHSWANVYLGANAAPAYDPVSGNIGYHARTAAEIAALVTPTNYSYPPGSSQRYGMDGTGVIACDTAFANACKCNAEVFDSYPGGGTYLFNTGVTINGTYPLRIRGQTRWFAGNTGNVGTKFILGSAAGTNAVLLKFTGGPLYAIEIAGIGFTCQDSTLGQVYINPQTDARGWIIERCVFLAPSNASNNTTAIQFQGAATYSGSTTIRDNFFDNVNVALVLTGICTTFKITNNEFIGYSTGAASGIGISMGSQVQGNPVIVGNYFEGYTTGIQAAGAVQMIQVANSYAVCTTPFNWTSATAHGTSLGEVLLSGAGAPVYATTDTSGNFVLGAGSFMAASNLTTTRTYTEGNGTTARSFPMGYPQAVTFAAGNFTGSGAMTWTVILAGQTVFWYSITGKTLTVNFSINGTVGGTPSTALQIAIPGGFTAASFALNNVSTFNGGAWAPGAAQVSAGASVIQIFNSIAGSANWTAGSASVVGQIQIQVA